MAAKALEWRRIGNPMGVPGALPGDETADPTEPMQPDDYWELIKSTLILNCRTRKFDISC